MTPEISNRLEIPEEVLRSEVFNALDGCISNQKGMGKFTFIVFGAIAGAAFYAIYHILPFFYYYYELQSHMEQLVKVGDLNTDKDIRRKLHYYMVKYQLPVGGEDLRIVRRGRHLSISVEYDQDFSIPWKDEIKVLRTFHFHAAAEGEY